jgi:hypothetical protein
MNVLSRYLGLTVKKSTYDEISNNSSCYLLYGNNNQTAETTKENHTSALHNITNTILRYWRLKV